MKLKESSAVREKTEAGKRGNSSLRGRAGGKGRKSILIRKKASKKNF